LEPRRHEEHEYENNLRNRFVKLRVLRDFVVKFRLTDAQDVIEPLADLGGLFVNAGPDGGSKCQELLDYTGEGTA
jgi:hypothetical protein